MIRDLLIESDAGQTRLAVVEDGELQEIYIERRGHEKIVGNIYVGRVENILPGMQAAFVDIGQEKNGFLYAGDAQPQNGMESETKLSVPIQKLLKAGQEIMVQVVKEGAGSKGPRLTGNVTLPGRMVVLLPTESYIGVSKKIEDDVERARLREIAERVKPEGMGLIIRTAAEGVPSELLTQDIQYLIKLWHSIEKRTKTSKAPALIHRELSLLSRAVRDMLKSDVNSLKIDNEEQYEEAKKHAGMIAAELTDKVEFYQREALLFDAFRVDQQIEKALQNKVWLKSGGYLIIDFTEALTVVDVNTGKYVGKTSLEETIFKINSEAVDEIAKQLKLRDVGGIIVIDFIDMEDPAHRDELLNRLRNALKKDRTKTNLVGITGLGLVEMTRKKVHQPLHTLLKQPCPICQSSGLMLTDETVARNALHELKARARRKESQAFLIETTPGIAGQLMLLGCPADIRAFVHISERHRFAEYEIEPTAEHELPPKTRQIPREIG